MVKAGFFSSRNDGTGRQFFTVLTHHKVMTTTGAWFRRRRGRLLAVMAAVALALYSVVFMEHKSSAAPTARSSTSATKGTTDLQQVHEIVHPDDNDPYKKKGTFRSFLPKMTLKSKRKQLLISKIIPSNPHSSLGKDVVSIRHDPQQSQVFVILRSGARCPRPYLMGRLSGPTLVKLEWTWSSNLTTTTTTTSTWNEFGQNATVMMGTYHVPLAGTFFLEIVVLYCHDIFYDLRDILETKMDPTHNWHLESPFRESMDLDYQHICMERPTRHRLTANHATIVVPTTTTDHHPATNHWFRTFRITNDKQPISSSSLSSKSSMGVAATAVPGYWKNTANTTTSQQQHQPLYTRHQPFNCMMSHRGGDPPPVTTCHEMTHLDRYEKYQFVWSNATTNNIQMMNVTQLAQPQPTVICMVGCSHSRVLWLASQRMGITLNKINVTIEWIPAHYPLDVSPNLLLVQNAGKHCQKFVIAVGQWPASYVPPQPWSVMRFYKEMKAVLLNLQNNLPHNQNSTTTAPSSSGSSNSGQGVEIFARSIHYNPLGYLSSTCPPREFRIPVLLDAYNTVLQKACLETNVSYIDTNFLVGPVVSKS